MEGALPAAVRTGLVGAGRRLRALRRRRVPWREGLAALFAIAALSVVLASWYVRAPRDQHVSGMFQGDMPTYVCYGRMAARSPTLLSYANAHDVREPPHRVFVNLPITVLGWLAALGLSPGQIETVLRFGFGLWMYLALAALIREHTRSRPLFWACFAAIGLGAGAAWVHGLLEHPGDLEQLGASVEAFELPYGWWFLDVFRNLFYPLELAYHALFFLQLAALGRRDVGRATLWYALGCASNPFLGIQMTAVQLGSVLLVRDVGWRPRAASVAVAVLFFGYYAGLLPHDLVARALEQQHTGVWTEPLGFDALFWAHGLAWVGVVALVLDAPFRRHVRESWSLVPVLVLLAATLVLVEHSRFDLGHVIIPMHFSRGYILVATWLVTFRWLEFRFARGVPPPVWLRGALVVLVLLTLPDNFFFVREQWRNMPHKPLLIWPSTTEEMLDYLRTQPGRRRVIADDWETGRIVCASTWHRSAFGTPQTTPEWDARTEAMREFRRDPSHVPSLVRWADTILVPAGDQALARACDRSGFHAVFTNAAWKVYERGPHAPPAAPPELPPRPGRTRPRLPPPAVDGGR